MGEGVISHFGGKPQNDNKYIEVKFEAKTVVFPYPSCFEKYLIAIDAEFKKTIEEDISASHPQKPAIPELPKENTYYDTVNTTSFITSSVTSLASRPIEELKYLDNYGTNSKTIYLNCCNGLGWDKSKAHNFGHQGARLYAKNATPEGYSVWFLSHHKMTNTKGGKWSNTIYKDSVYEEWDNAENGIWDDKSTRVLFVKFDGSYHFYGIFAVDTVIMNGNFKYTKIYKRIGNTYPG